MSTLLSALRKGEQVMIDGVEGVYQMTPEKQSGQLLEPGDLYVAEKNTGPQLLTCKEVKLTIPDGRFVAWVVPEEEAAYCFDFWDCVGVTRID